MSTAASSLLPNFPEPVFRLSVQQYHHMIHSGILTDDDPVELLEGVLVFKRPENPQHRVARAKLRNAIEPLLGPDFSLQLQEPLTLSDSEPEPDAAVIKGQPEDYRDRHPGPADTMLVIEISDTTLPRDRGLKLRTYARAGISNYWIINLQDRQVEVFFEPAFDDQSGEYRYAHRHVYAPSQNLPVHIVASAQELPVVDVLP